MANTDLSSERTLRRMTRAHGGVIVILGALALLIHVTLADRIGAIRADAHLINRAGLERMHLQRSALLAMRLADAPFTKRPALRAALRRQAHIMWRLWRSLPPLRASRPGQLTARLAAFVGALRAAARGGGHAAASLKTVVAAADGPLVPALNRRVLAYQHAADRDNTDLAVFARDQFFLMVSALGALTLFIFMPLWRLMRAEIRKMNDLIAYNRTLFEAAPDGIVVIDEGGIIEAFNPAAEVLFGRAAEDVRGQCIELLMPEPDRSQHAGYLRRHLETGERRIIGQLREVTAVRQDGTLFPVELSVGSIDGGRRRFVGLLRDLTARNAAERALELVHQRYQALVANISAGIFRVEAANPARFVEVNPAMLTLFDAPEREALLAQPLATLFVRDEDRVIFSEQWDPVTLGADREVLLRTLQGREFWALLSAVRKRDAGQVYFDGFMEDVTERRKAAEALSALNRDLRQRIIDLDVANKELEAFSYSVSHDLRAPLRSIDGFSQALLEDYADLVDATGRDYLSRVRAASQKMAQLIDDILQLSRVSRARLVRSPVDLSAMAYEIADTLTAGKTHRDVEWRIEAGLGVMADAVLIRQVLTNLLANAWKFTSKRTDAVIEVGQVSREGVREIFVRDNGAGFDMTYADRLFGVFQRLHASHDFEGTGIGLAIVQRIVRRHGGDVRAHGEVGKGARFSFTIPNEGDFDASRT
ncbi:MAG: PAS domain S-box protein [Acidiferrobacter sp.]